MRRAFAAAVVGLFVLASVPAQAADVVYTWFGDYVEALRVQLGIPGLAAAIVGPTDVLWERGFGYQDVSRSLPMRPDTPIPADGLTQVFTASFMLQCAEANHLALDDAIGAYLADAPEPTATFRQLLSHTTRSAAGLTFQYRPERLDALAGVIRRCTGASYLSTTAHELDRLAMVNSVPGADVLSFLPPPDPLDPASESTRYSAALERLTKLYSVDTQKRATQVGLTPAAQTLSPSTGLITTVRDYAQFDLALRGGILMTPETLAEAWRPSVDATGKALPHGLGWFVQSYNGEPVIWQFGSAGDAGSSSMVITMPTRGLTLVLMANSSGLVKTFPLAKGDVTTSPFARIFLSLFTRSTP
ncbi:MAG: serine hydrolase domain-containing protein [Vicinamibacterales bacterium]